MSMRRFALPALAGTSALGAVVYYRSSARNSQSSPQNKSSGNDEKPNRHPAAGKLTEGLGGAGVGGNATTGGHESSPAGVQKTNTTAPKEKLPSGGVGGGVGGGGANVRTIEMSQQKDSGTYGSGDGSYGSGGERSKADSEKSAADSLYSRGGKKSEDTGSSSGQQSNNDSSNKTPSYQNPSASKGTTTSGKGSAGPSQNDGSGASSASATLQGLFGQGGANAADKDETSNKRRWSDTKIHSNHAETPTKNAAGGGKMG